MPDRFSDIRITTESMEAEPAPSVAALVEERAFSVAFLGDFSGRESRSAHRTDAASLQPDARLVDRDTLDEVMARLAPELSLDFQDGGPSRRVGFRELDDFHPDQLFARLPVFRELRDLRARLADTSSFTEAAAEIRKSDAGAESQATTEAPPPAPDPAGFLERVLDATASSEAAVAEAGVPGSYADFRGLVHRLIAPHLVADADPRQAELVAEVDVAVAGQMRGVLHHPEFQALEALWRMLDLVVRRLETGVLLRIYLVDLTREELEVDLRQPAGSVTPLRELLRRGPEGGSRGPWSLLAGAYAFDAGDVELLASLAGLAARVGAPWVSAAQPGLSGASDAAALAEPRAWQAQDPAWDEFRRSAQARWIGLALPRVLVRLPYGEDSDPIDAFRFEEVEEADPQAYLWANPALACALFLGRAFARSGWAMDPRGPHDLDGLPIHVLGEGVDARAQPGAEALIPDAAAERLLDAGLMPFLAARDGGLVRLLRFQSVASPLSRLAGPWD